ncbi:MAG: 2-dehydropantoate 2-reductase N-terminal domain-containing protein, partial [Lentisphaeria bacterium]
MTKILSLGSGALSSYYSGKLQFAGAEITMLCRSDYNFIREKGIFVKSIDGNFHYHPTRVISNIAEIGTKFPDYICVFYKSLPSIPLIEILRAAVGPNTTIVLIQNGFDLETPIAQEFPNNEILGGLGFICCERESSGHIIHHDLGAIKLGCHSNHISEKALELQRIFINANVDCSLVANLRYARWEKLVWNVAFNPLSAILGGVTTNF